MSDGKKLIAAIIAAGAVSELRKVDRDSLLPDEAPVYDFVRTHYRRYGVLPAIATVEGDLAIRLPTIREGVEYYRGKVADRQLFNAIRTQYDSLRSALKDRNLVTAREAIDGLKSATRVYSDDNDLRTVSEAAEYVLAQYEHAHLNPGVTGVPSYWPELDEVTGGYQDGDLISWVARMGSGKTMFALLQAIGAWHLGYSVLFVTMEMTIEQIVRRLLGIEAGINTKYIRKGALSTPVYNRLVRFAENMRHTDRFNVYAGGFSKKVGDIDILMHELCPDIIFIDGAYLLRPSVAGRMNRIERVSEVYDELKRMTITSERPIVTTSQFSRQAGKKGVEGSLENVAFTDAIGMHSSLVFSIKPGKPPYQDSRREIELLKGREGEAGTFVTHYTFSPMRFSVVPQEELAQESTDVDWMGA